MGTDAAGRQIIRTRVFIRGVEKRSYDRVVVSPTANTASDFGESDLQLEDGESSGGNFIPVAVELYCPEDTEDCMAEPEAEQLELEWLAIEADAAALEEAVNEDFNACVWVDDECRAADYPHNNAMLAASFSPFEGDSEVWSQGCDTNLSNSAAGPHLGDSGAQCWWPGTVMLAACGTGVVAAGAVGAAIAIRSWKLFLAAAAAAILAADACFDAIDAWFECKASEDPISFGSWLRKQETVFVGAY